jgi:hypothetical protein
MVKSLLHEIVAVAIGILSENENYNGWKHFLEQVKDTIPLLSQAHYHNRVTYSYFNFISHCDKGIEQALGEVFSNNISTHYAIHIQCNVWTKFGIKASANVGKVAGTFSI